MKHSDQIDNFVTKRLTTQAEDITKKNQQSSNNSKCDIEKQFCKFLNEKREMINCQTASDCT